MRDIIQPAGNMTEYPDLADDRYVYCLLISATKPGALPVDGEWLKGLFEVYEMTPTGPSAVAWAPLHSARWTGDHGTDRIDGTACYESGPVDVSGARPITFAELNGDWFNPGSD